MSESDVSKKSGNKFAFAIGAVLLVGALLLNGYALQFRQKSIKETEAAILEAAQLSESIALDQQIQNGLPGKRELVAKLGPELDSMFDMFGRKEYREGLPAEFLPAVSEFLYVCIWGDYETKELHGRVFIPDSSQHRLVFFLTGIDEVLTPLKPREIKFDI